MRVRTCEERITGKQPYVVDEEPVAVENLLNCCPRHNHHHSFWLFIKLAYKITDDRKRLTTLTNLFAMARARAMQITFCVYRVSQKNGNRTLERSSAFII